MIGRPKQYTEPRVNTSLRLPASLHRRLQAAAAERGVAVNLLMERAVARYLDKLIPVDHLDNRPPGPGPSS